MSKQLTFIASGGRTGTQFLAMFWAMSCPIAIPSMNLTCLQAFHGVRSTGVRRFGMWHMGPGRTLGQTGVRILGQSYLEGRIDAHTCAARLRKTRKRYHAATPENLIIESYYAWWMIAEEISLVFPGAKIAGILRDPRDWITSWLRHEPDRRNGTLTERLPPGPLEPAKIGDHAAAELWPGLDQMGKLAWEWGLIVKTLGKAAAASPNVRVFRFEDLFGGNLDALTDFVSFVTTHEAGPAHQVGDITGLLKEKRNASSGAKQRLAGLE